MAGHRSQPQAAFRRDTDKCQIGDIVQVDQHRRLRQAEIHHRDQALPAGQGLGIVTMPGEEGQGFID
jgi:hypothetical protein